jgi:hypothetical protein
VPLNTESIARRLGLSKARVDLFLSTFLGSLSAVLVSESSVQIDFGPATLIKLDQTISFTPTPAPM